MNCLTHTTKFFCGIQMYDDCLVHMWLAQDGRRYLGPNDIVYTQVGQDERQRPSTAQHTRKPSRPVFAHRTEPSPLSLALSLS